MGTLKPQRNGPLYSNTVTCTLAVDGWAGIHLVQRRGARAGGESPPHCTKCNSPTPINGQCTNYQLRIVLFNVAL